MSKVFYTHDEITGRPRLEGKDPSHVHFHFRPARPANFCVTLDPDTQEVNVMAGTIGPLTWNPYTMCMHIDRHNSVDTYRNLQRTEECVVALPGKDIIPQTWMCELHVPRGINELEVSRLTPFQSKSGIVIVTTRSTILTSRSTFPEYVHISAESGSSTSDTYSSR